MKWTMGNAVWGKCVKGAVFMAILALVLTALPGAGQAAIVKADLIAAEGDLVPPNNEPITNLNIPMEDGAGRPVFTGQLDNTTSGPEAFVWYDTGVAWRNSDDPSLVLGSMETQSGAGSLGQFFFSASVGGLDSAYSHGGLLLAEEDPAPGFPGQFSAFNSRPRMAPNGTAWWIGGYTSVQGGGTEQRVLYRASDANDVGSITPVVDTSQMVGGKLFDGPGGITFNYDFSDLGNHYILETIMQPGSNDVVLDGAFLIEEGDAAGDGNNWQAIDIVGVNNSGDWFVAGDTDGPIATDDIISFNGDIKITEGDIVDGIMLATPATVQGAALNNMGAMAFIWSYDSGTSDTLFIGYGPQLDQAQALLSVGDELDTDGNGSGDYVVTDINHSTNAHYGLDLGDGNVIYLEVDLEPSGGGVGFEAIIRLTFDLPDPLIVTHTGDSGIGSLRFAMEYANSLNGQQTISFDLPSTSTRVIQPLSALPPITDPVIIDASADDDGACSPTVELDGSLAGPASGFTILGGNTTIRGFIINNWDGAGIYSDIEPGNTIQCNYIGTDRTGTVAAPNINNGILVFSGQDLIGGTGLGEGNLISGNNDNGIQILNTSGTLILGNTIGTDLTGSIGIQNDNGVLIHECTDIQVGGPGAGEGNLISGNQVSGVQVNLSDNVFVQGNVIGLNAAGNAAVPNGDRGVTINASSQCLVQANVISGNGGPGVLLTGGAGVNAVYGNMIGTDAAGLVDLGNAGLGIQLQDSSNNTLGGPDPGERNLISGNELGGILLNNSDSNSIQNNWIGVDSTGNASLPNITNGIGLTNGSSSNLIGGSNANEGNLISGNTLRGINIIQPSTVDNFVYGNRIGTNEAGTAAIPNFDSGVYISQGVRNTIGGIGVGQSNLISGNSASGIIITTNADNNDVVGNIIGLNAAGDTALRNDVAGIRIFDSIMTEIISNVISGHDGLGSPAIELSSAGSTQIYHNRIGTDASGMTAIPNYMGISIHSSSVGNLIGAPGMGNVISGNFTSGVFITGVLANQNSIRANIIGADATGSNPMPNTAGVTLAADTFSNQVGGFGLFDGNIIAYNSFSGVDVGTSATLNPIVSNSIHSNGRLGIDLNTNNTPEVNDPLDADTGGNMGQNYPVLSHGFSACEVVSEINGTLHSEPNTTFTIQVFWNEECDPSGFGEGYLMVDVFDVQTDGLGDAAFMRAVGPFTTGYLTATATSPRNNTSEFSECLGVGDNEPPSITCPADIVVPGAPGVCDIFVNVPQPTISDDCTSPELLLLTNDYTNTDDASAVYPGGTTVVTWTVVDEAGNVSECQMNVTVTCEVECSLDPSFAVNPVGTSHTVTLSVTVNGAAATSGSLVFFEITSGPNFPTTGTATLDILGQAQFSWLSNGLTGTDTVVATGSIGGSEFQCDADKEWTDTVPTPTPTPTPTATPTPTPTATPTPTPSPTPCTPNDYQFEGTDDGWTTGGAPMTFDLPAFGQTPSALTIGPNGFFTFGFWQSPSGAITSALSDHLYAVRFNLSWNEDPCEAPTMRLRAIAEDFSQLEVLGINSTGDCSVAPDAAPRDYVMHFIPQAGGANNDFIVALDQLAFDPFDSATGTVTVDYVDIHCFPLSSFTFDPLLNYNFAGSTEGWTTGSAQLLTPPLFADTPTGLSMTSTNNVTTFGFWQSPDAPVMSTAGKMLVGEYNYTTPPVVVGTAASIRLRMITTDSQGFRYTEFPAVPKLVGVEGAGVGVPPTIVYEAPAGSDVNLVFDFINFNLSAADNFTVELNDVTVTETDAPVLP